METVLEILEDLVPGVDFMQEENLIDDGILDSFGIVSLVAELSDAFDIAISPLELVPDNFRSVHTIYALVSRLQEEE